MSLSNLSIRCFIHKCVLHKTYADFFRVFYNPETIPFRVSCSLSIYHRLWFCLHIRKLKRRIKKAEKDLKFIWAICMRSTLGVRLLLAGKIFNITVFLCGFNNTESQTSLQVLQIEQKIN